MASEDQTTIPFPVLQGKRKKWHAETSVQSKSVKRAARFRSYSVKGAEKEKSKGVQGKKEMVDSNQMAAEARPGHMARGFLDLLCLERKAHNILLHSIHTHVSNQHCKPAQSFSQLIYLPVLYFMKLGNEGKLGELKWLVNIKTLPHIHWQSCGIKSGHIMQILYQTDSRSGLEKLA